MLELLSIPEPYNAELKLSLDGHGVNTPLRIAHFISQARHESANFTVISENLNYSSVGLMSIFPKHFPDKSISDAYARQPEKIANRAYADRNGNGDEASWDGWKFRGRGIFMITGKSNYTAFGLYIKENICDNPDLLLTAEYAVKSALWFWVKTGLNDIADKGSEDSIVQEITKRVNGGLNGISDRIKLFKKCYAALI